MDKKGKEFGTVIWQPVVPFNFVCWTLYICSCILIWLRCFPASLKFSSLPSPPFQGFSGRDFFYITVKFKTYRQCVWYMYITRGFPSVDDMHWPTLLSQNWASWAVIDLLQHAVPPSQKSRNFQSASSSWPLLNILGVSRQPLSPSFYHECPVRSIQKKIPSVLVQQLLSP